MYVMFSCSVKQKLHEMLQTDKDFNSEDEDRLNPCHQISIANALKFIKNPKKCCEQIYNIIQQLRHQIWAEWASWYLQKGSS